VTDCITKSFISTGHLTRESFKIHKMLAHQNTVKTTQKILNKVQLKRLKKINLLLAVNDKKIVMLMNIKN